MEKKLKGKECEKREKKIERMDKEKREMFVLLASSDGNGDSTMVTNGDGGYCFLQ
jgi:hypothetical protein